MTAPENDTRRFWIFSCEQGHPVGVLTDAGYTREWALDEMYGGRRAAKKAIYERGIQLRLIEAPEFHRDYPVERVSRGCTCPS